jgi:hypothetical protein
VAYLVSRAIGLVGFEEAVGDWAEPVGNFSLIIEGLYLAGYFSVATPALELVSRPLSLMGLLTLPLKADQTDTGLQMLPLDLGKPILRFAAIRSSLSWESRYGERGARTEP